MNKELRLKVLKQNLLSDSKLKYILSQCTDKKPEDVIHDFTKSMTAGDNRVGHEVGSINIHYRYVQNIIPFDYIEIYVLCGTDLCMPNKNDYYSLITVQNLHLIIAQAIYDIVSKVFSDIKDINVFNTWGTYTDGLPCQNAVRLTVNFKKTEEK